MNLNAASLMVGVLAGLAAALLSISAGEPTALSILLFAAATLPVLIASLGWSNGAGFVAAAVAGAIVALFISPQAGLVFAATTLAPAAWIGHLATLSRPAEELGGPEGAVAWYPLADILQQLCIMVIIGLVAVGVATGYGEAMIDELVGEFFTVMNSQNPDLQLGEEDRAAYARFFLYALPAVQGALWVAILFVAFHVAAGIVRLSGRARRPKDDIPTSLRMTRISLYLFVTGLVLTALGGAPALAGAVVVGALSAGFVFAGFAIMHERTRGKTWRPFALWGAYFAVVVFTLPILFFQIAGMIGTARAVPISRPPPNDGRP